MQARKFKVNRLTVTTSYRNNWTKCFLGLINEPLHEMIFQSRPFVVSIYYLVTPPVRPEFVRGVKDIFAVTPQLVNICHEVATPL
jgi:hypothetical protein